MRVLHVIGSMNPLTGGPCQGIRYSIPELEKEGVYREVACIDAPTTDYLASDHFSIHALGPSYGPWQYAPKLYSWLQLNMSAFHVVIINGLWLYTSYAVWRTARWLKKQGKPVPRIYVMPHGMLDPYFQKASHRRWKALRNEIFWRLIEHKIVRDADGLLFTTETELLLARETFPDYKPKAEYNVGYGTPEPPARTPDMVQAWQTRGNLPQHRRYWLFMSRIHNKKGVDLLLNAYADLLRTTPDVPALVIAGPGMETNYGKQLALMVADNPALTGSVYFPGMLTGPAKWGALYGCEAFILPSHQENFGIVVAEALACGKPVLISDQVNIWKEIVEVGGGFVETNTLEGTKRLLERWMKLTAAEAADMGRRARQTYETYFTIHVTSMRLLKVIDRKKFSITRTGLPR